MKAATAQKQSALTDFTVRPTELVHSSTSTSRFGDDFWEFDLSINKPTASRIRLHFLPLTGDTRDLAKYLIWTTLNVDTPLEKLSRKASTRSRISVATVRSIFSDMQPFFRWLEARPERFASELDTAALSDYSNFIASGPGAHESKSRKLFDVTRLWLLSPYLPHRHRLVQPPWEEPHAMNDLVGSVGWSAENKTVPIHPQTVSPLLVWSQRIVENFSADILEAANLRSKMDANLPQYQALDHQARIQRMIDDIKREGGITPGSGVSRKGAGGSVASQYLAGKYGVTIHGLSRALRSNSLPIGHSAPLEIQPKGTIDGQLWTNAIDYYEVNELVRILVSACLVVIAYLSGMRAEEVRALTRGCCTKMTGDDGAETYVITGTTFKAATDSRGNMIPQGEARRIPWHVIAPVANAISVVESLHTEDLLFPHSIYGMKNGPGANPNMSVSNQRAKTAISELVSWCNARAVSTNRAQETIPKDPAGDLTLRRFRRTLAWFIYRLPGGRVALGVQYGHLHSYTTDGYGSRVSAGLRDLFPMEEAFSVADSLQRAVDESVQGESHASGPAAQRYVRGVREFRDVYAGKSFGVKQAASLMRNPALRIYDNGAQPLACCYDPTKALCHPDRNPSKTLEQSPDPTACDSRCANIARTDTHIQRIHESIEEAKAAFESELTPQPIKQRLKQRLESLRAQVDQHRIDGIDL